ncbi:MAG: CBS domain-containing protein [Planctomycetales bacterium]|nr:CBS domain-containing protein [Planctomycetales bacterium]
MAFELNLQTDHVGHVRGATPPSFPPDVSIRKVIDTMQVERRGSAVVCDPDGKLIGIFTERDALRLLAAKSNLDLPIESVMAKEPVTVAESDTVGESVRRMATGGYRRLPIVDGSNRPTGIVKATEILHYLVEHFPEFVYNLPPSPDQTNSQREGALG